MARQIADEPFRPGRSISGFRTGPLGMGHVVLTVPSIDTRCAFYRDLLGFKISDYIRDADHRLFPARQSAPSQPGAVRGPHARACIT